MLKKIIVNADDWGLHSSINEAIVDGVNIGCINGISVCVNGTASDINTLRYLYQKGIRIGLHLTWVGEPWLTKKVQFHNWKNFLIAYLLNKKNFINDIIIESEAQLNKLVEAGIIPSHIDSHQHLHVLPELWEYVNLVALKIDNCNVRSCYVKDRKWIKKGVSGKMLQKFASKNFNEEQSFFSCAGIKYSGNNTLATIKKEINENSSNFIELIVHPGKSNQELSSKFPKWNYNWEAEYHLLMSPEFIPFITRSGYLFV